MNVTIHYFLSLPCGKDVKKSHCQQTIKRSTLLSSNSITGPCSVCKGSLEQFGGVNLGQEIGCLGTMCWEQSVAGIHDPALLSLKPQGVLLEGR